MRVLCTQQARSLGNCMCWRIKQHEQDSKWSDSLSETHLKLLYLVTLRISVVCQYHAAQSEITCIFLHAIKFENPIKCRVC